MEPAYARDGTDAGRRGPALPADAIAPPWPTVPIRERQVSSWPLFVSVQVGIFLPNTHRTPNDTQCPRPSPPSPSPTARTARAQNRHGHGRAALRPDRRDRHGPQRRCQRLPIRCRDGAADIPR